MLVCRRDAADGVRRSLARAAPDVHWLDLGLPDGDVHSLIAEVAHAHPTRQTLVISVLATMRKRLRHRGGGSGLYRQGPAVTMSWPITCVICWLAVHPSSRIARRLLHRSVRTGRTAR